MKSKTRTTIIILLVCLAVLLGSVWFLYNRPTGPPLSPPASGAAPAAPTTTLPLFGEITAEELEILSCEDDSGCVVEGYVGCCPTCIGVVANKAAADKATEQRNRECSLTEIECKMINCLGIPPLNPVCRDNICLSEVDYVIKQAAAKQDSAPCEDLDDHNKGRCYYVLALALGDEALCQQALNEKDCYNSIAIIKKDRALCSKGWDTCYLQIGVYYNEPEHCGLIADWLDYETCKQSVSAVAERFKECEEKTGQERNGCYLDRIETAWAPYYTMEIFCDKTDNPAACYRRYLSSY